MDRLEEVHSDAMLHVAVSARRSDEHSPVGDLDDTGASERV
jgi:hypothetical protein